MNQKLFKILLCIILFSGIANANENKQNIELVTKKFTHHFIHEVAPEIVIPEYLKKYKFVALSFILLFVSSFTVALDGDSLMYHLAFPYKIYLFQIF